MPFREQEYREVCSACSELADAQCPRCQRPTCKDHRVPDLLCRSCETEYKAHEWSVLPQETGGGLAKLIVGAGAVAIVGGLLVLLYPMLKLAWAEGHYIGFIAPLAATGAFTGPLLHFYCPWSSRRLTAQFDRWARARLRAKFIASGPARGG
jgi:hypothetical protein